MSRIRKLYFSDRNSLQDMISFLNNQAKDKYLNALMFNPLIILHHLLPLSLKFLPESYVIKEENFIKGLISIAPRRSWHKKMEIQKLFFEENSYDIASELVQYVVSKYKAMGAPSITVKVDDHLPELLTMFVAKCGFTQISYEKLWRINKIPDKKYSQREFRSFRNSDAQAIANLYNDSLLPHLRYLLGCQANEYKENLLKGLSYYSEYKYSIIDKNNNNIIGYLSIQTLDNENYILDFIKASWIDLDIDSIISFATEQIRKRKKRFGLFIKSKRYLNFGDNLEKHFFENNFECVQNQIVLTNSSAKIIKKPMESKQYTILSDYCPNGAMPVS